MTRVGISAMAIDPQWWWSTVFLPAAGGIGWLLKYWYDDQQAKRADKHADRSDHREEQSAEFTQIRETNTILVSQVQGLDAKVQQFDPTLAQIQKEYRDALTREMEGMERERELKMRAVDLEAENRALRARVTDLGGTPGNTPDEPG